MKLLILVEVVHFLLTYYKNKNFRIFENGFSFNPQRKIHNTFDIKRRRRDPSVKKAKQCHKQ